MDNNKWAKVDSSKLGDAEDTRPSLTYWADVWYRFSRNKVAMVGLVMVVIIVLFAIVGPWFSPYTYADQQLEFGNTPPVIKVTEIAPDTYVYIHKEFKIIMCAENGAFTGVPTIVEDNVSKRYRTYDINGMEVKLDYTKALKVAGKVVDNKALKYDIYVDGKPVDVAANSSTKLNKSFMLGSDKLGRDVWTRTLYGARISLLVGVVAALVNAVVGVVYGGLSGYEGGKVDNVMMRIVDLINSIPLMLIVIIVMVVFDQKGLGTIILTIGLVYWVTMARQVRGQVLSLKEQEFVLAARTLGASKSKIIFRHLIPNALGPIVVTMMMSIPSAIFTESFLSFVGLGVSAPQASWGTLASDALGGIRSFPYLLIIPSLAIALTMFAFNFVGDGMRDALDPKQR